jgi:hypothetical protein
VTYLEIINKALLKYTNDVRKLNAISAEFDEAYVEQHGGCSCSGSSIHFYINYKRASDKNWRYYSVDHDPIEFLLEILPDYVE